MRRTTGLTLRTLRAGLGALALVLAACGTGDDESTDAQDASEAPDRGGQEAGRGELDLATLVAEVDEGTLHAESFESTFVGEVGDELFIGVAVEDGPDGEPRDVAVYLCDDELIGEWISGEIDATGVGTLTSSETMIDYRADGELRVDLAVTDDEVRGSVSFENTFDEPFTAELAADGAGLFRAEETFDGERHQAGWIIFNDGRRVGTHCFWARNPLTGDVICGCKQIK